MKLQDDLKKGPKKNENEQNPVCIMDHTPDFVHGLLFYQIIFLISLIEPRRGKNTTYFPKIIENEPFLTDKIDFESFTKSLEITSIIEIFKEN